ncbi:Bromodomain-containing protein [Cladochytrium replicatum]|nr:Bromodomain-containing protein [Cladochytrium replicatum]
MQSAFVQLVKRVLNAVENYKEKSTDRMVADLFLVVPSPDEYPDYYAMIKKPIAIADMQKKNKMGIYTSYADVIADFKLMLENAATYNKKGSQVVKDAKTLMQNAENLLKKELEGTVWDPATHQPQPTSGVPSPTPSTPATPNSARQSATKKPSPDELRNIIKKLTSYKNREGRSICEIFLTLPSATDYPDYYVEIKRPIAVDMIKKKVSQREYTSMNQFESDFTLMFDNAHQFNEEGSIVYEDATELQAVFMHAIGKGPPPNSKPAPTEGRVPLTEAEHNGETFTIGQCVHVKNYVDPSKPIICQITEVYKKKDGKIYLQGAWYLRPENTVHRSSQKFMEFEVFKTTHMEEYHLTDVQDTCFVLFVKDYVRGRPRNLRPGQSVYVCESRYNEQRENMQKIKQWKDSIKIDLEIYTTPIVPKRVKSLFATDEVTPARRKGSEDVDISDSDTPAAPASGTKRRRSVSPKPPPAGASAKKVAAIPGSAKAHSSSSESFIFLFFS